jgi:hypothetical protein
MKITEKLINWPMCAPFRELADPVRDGVPDQSAIIPAPMALTEVRRKLVLNEYETIEAWKRDISSIWQNAEILYLEGTIFTQRARETSIWFNQKMKRFPLTQEEDWVRKMQRTAKKSGMRYLIRQKNSIRVGI